MAHVFRSSMQYLLLAATSSFRDTFEFYFSVLLSLETSRLLSTEPHCQAFHEWLPRCMNTAGMQGGHNNFQRTHRERVKVRPGMVPAKRFWSHCSRDDLEESENMKRTNGCVEQETQPRAVFTPLLPLLQTFCFTLSPIFTAGQRRRRVSTRLGYLAE